jgi:hypothetical protein
LVQIILGLREFYIVQIKGQVLFKLKIIAKMGWSHLKIFSKEPQSQKSSYLHESKLSVIM